MNKKILTLVLALVMVLGTFSMAFAEVEVEKVTNPKVQWLIDNDIVEGRLQDDGKTKVFDLDKTITREEVTKLVIFHRSSTELARALQGTKGNYTDVAVDRWSNGYINAATVEKLVEGYPDKSFQPAGDITYAEVAAILVRMDARWTDADEKNAQWPLSYIKAAEDFGILKDIKLKDVNEKAVREIVFEMMYNAFDGRYEAPIVNDDLGVISNVWADKIELNDDVEYTITRDTIFIGNSLNLIYNRVDLLGSLVRVAIDKDNEVSHVVVLGQAGIAEPIGKWAGIANDGVIKDVAPAANATKANNDEIVLNGEKLVVNDKTRIFVADVEKGNFYEAKKVEDAVKEDDARHMSGIYAAYDVQAVTDVKYARVIVFSAGKEPSTTKNLRRITANVNRDYVFEAENTRAVVEEFNTKAFRDIFPYEYGFEKMDVVELKMAGENGVRGYDMKIDYSEDPVFEVTDVAQFLRFNADGSTEFRGNSIELRDEDGREAEFALDLDGVSVFTHTIDKGNHVQVHFADKENKVIDIISIVDKALDGALPRGEFDRVCGVLDDILLTDAMDAHIKLAKVAEGSETNLLSYRTASTQRVKVIAVAEGHKDVELPRIAFTDLASALTAQQDLTDAMVAAVVEEAGGFDAEDGLVTLGTDNIDICFLVDHNKVYKDGEPFVIDLVVKVDASEFWAEVDRQQKAADESACKGKNGDVLDAVEAIKSKTVVLDDSDQFEDEAALIEKVASELGVDEEKVTLITSISKVDKDAKTNVIKFAVELEKAVSNDVLTGEEKEVKCTVEPFNVEFTVDSEDLIIA